ncbi:site-specific integrase [Flagellimonas sp. CMM7]|uniref:tyrosine-type recombinase/integrase n=1 Tax=Flagellimonas sp. CMM7 TaxID=2654676 RepID=UPI0013D7A474|nr:site-specific integrase [Flagellimonas sp. CMM7]UII81116.1 site-specific integrase [Flagellimonas sp. CMM7]
MALIRLALDTRKNARNRHGLFPIVLRVFHKKQSLIRLGHYTSINGWDDRNSRLKKSAAMNRNLDCDEINRELDGKLYAAKELARELGSSIDKLDFQGFIDHIKEKWDYNPTSEIRHKIDNQVSISVWGKVVTDRKKSANSPATAKWYQDGIDALVKFNKGKDIMLYDITVSFLKDFEAYHLGRGNSKNTISIYLRAIRSIYNNAIQEDKFIPVKNAFEQYRIPSSTRTKKRVVGKEKIINIKELRYEFGSPLWHTKNYTLIMFYCRGMNFIDLVKTKVKDISNGRLYYGRSKTGNPFSVKITEGLQNILNHYINGKKPSEYLLPTNYDGSSKHYQKYKSQRRRMNERLKIIAKDAGIEGSFTTYYIRHSWATIAKYMGISTEIISEGLGHSSIRTTEIYLKDFDDRILDEANEMIVS